MNWFMPVMPGIALEIKISRRIGDPPRVPLCMPTMCIRKSTIEEDEREKK